jgi:ubiquinone/menaquinone biosynthesis C-methylase UbiE
MKNSWDSIYKPHKKNSELVWKSYADLFVLDRFITNLPLNAKILDFGCGDGRNIIHLLKLGFKVTGIDISKNALECSKELAEKMNLSERMNLIHGDIHSTIISNESFDLIYSTQVLDHIEEPQLVINEAFRILQKKGRFIVQMSSTKDNAISLGTFISPKKRNYKGFLFRFFDRNDIETLFSKWHYIIDNIKIQDPPHPGWRDEAHEHDYWIVEAYKK